MIFERQSILCKFKTCKKIYLLVIFLFCMTNISSCFLDLFYEYEEYPPITDIPDVFIEIPPHPDLWDHQTVPTYAWKITNSGLVLGAVHGGNPPTTNPSGAPMVFVVRYDESYFRYINPPGAEAAWAGDINESGVVVGTYLINGRLHAYKINADGTGFLDLNPPGSTKSFANVVLNSGVILGTADGIPCLLPTDGSPTTALIPGYSNINICCANENYVLLASRYMGEILLYDLESGNYVVLSIPDFPVGYFTLSQITKDNTLLGWCETGDYNEYVSFSYKIGDSNAWYYGGPVYRDGYEYSNFRFSDCTSQGLIVGRVFRYETGSYGFSVERAAVFKLNVSEFSEVTPWDQDGFSNLYSVNESNWAVGNGAFSYGDEDGRYRGSAYRAFIMKVD